MVIVSKESSELLSHTPLIDRPLHEKNVQTRPMIRLNYARIGKRGKIDIRLVIEGGQCRDNKISAKPGCHALLHGYLVDQRRYSRVPIVEFSGGYLLAEG